jgi:hypothetical protein
MQGWSWRDYEEAPGYVIARILYHIAEAARQDDDAPMPPMAAVKTEERTRAKLAAAAIVL